MFKIILAVLVTLGAVTSVPALRTRAEPLYSPVFARIEPRIRVVTDPYRRMRASTQERDIIRLLSQEQSEGKTLPVLAEFRSWQKYNNVKVDPWGGQFYVLLRHDSMYVGSNGPDRRRGNKDDILTGTPWR